MKPSAPATCLHVNRDNTVCGAPLRLMLTPSPIRGFDYLIVQRCPEHIASGWGVLPEPEFANNDDEDDGA